MDNIEKDSSYVHQLIYIKNIYLKKIEICHGKQVTKNVTTFKDIL